MEIDNELFVNSEFIEQEKAFSRVYRMLDEYWTEEIFDCIDDPLNEEVRINQTIWILWLQGIDKAPRLVKKCYESVVINKPSYYDVIVLDEYNLNEYVSLPKHILSKYLDGTITKTHFSDIIRAKLLYQYGGCWIDGTVYCMDRIPGFTLSGDLFVFNLAGIMTDPVLKLSSWWIYCKKGSRIMCAVWNILMNYWENENELADYFLFHIVFSKVVSEDSICSGIFRSVPYYNSGNAHVLYSKLGQKFDVDSWNVIRFISPIQKLSYKKRFLQGDIYSNYMHIVS